MAATTWKKWKIGFYVAILFGLLTAGAGLVGDMGWKSFVAVLCTALLTNLGSYLMKHPIEEVEDTALFERHAPNTSNFPADDPSRLPLWFLIGLGLAGALALPGCAWSIGGRNGLTMKPMTIPKDRIISMSVSSIGIMVGQNQTTQTPEFHIGYKRFSAQVIPTSTTEINTVPFRVTVGVNKDGFDAGVAETIESGEAAEPGKMPGAR